MTKTVTLTIDEWDRIVEIMDTQHMKHPDTSYLLAKIHSQLTYNPNDVTEQAKLPKTK